MNASTATEPTAAPRARRRRRRHARRPRRGTAEIELVFGAVVMVTLMFLVWGAFRVSRARQELVRDANVAAADRADGWSLFALPDFAFWSTEDVDPPEAKVEGAPDVVPGIGDLPNRMYAKRPRQYVRTFAGSGLVDSRAWLSARSARAGPSWTWFGWPRNDHQSEDAQAVQNWYGEVGEMCVGSVKDRLRLAD